MSPIQLWKFIATIYVLIFLTACQTVPIERKPQPASAFDLDTLYAEQSLIGTTPQQPSWSTDGQQVAFLWNDAGYTFRDVWSYSVTTGEKHRLTHLAEHKNKQGWHPGISEVVWLDAAKIAYVLDGKLYFQQADNEPQQMESDKSRLRNLTVSPNGQYLAFTAEGSLWLRSTDMNATNESQLLIDRGQPKAYIESYAWSKDSQQLVFKLTNNSPLPERDIFYYADAALQKYQVQRAFPGEKTAEFKIGIVNINGQDSRYFDRPNTTDYIWDYALSTDGQSLMINSSDLLVKDHSVFVYDVHTAEHTLYYHEHDPKHLRPDWQVAWAPNDDGLIIMTDRDGYLHLYHQRSADSKAEALTHGNWEIASFEVDHNNEKIYFIGNKSHLAERQIYSVSMTGNDIKRISAAEPGSHQMSFSTDKQYITTLFSSDNKPLELYVINLNSMQTTQITDSPQPLFHQLPWANISYIEFNSHLDDTKLLGRLSLPANYTPNQRYPLIVGSVYSDSVQNQYGGRTSHPTWGFDQYLTAQGYIVLNVNVRGSWGQGRKHNQGLRYSYGVIDIEDLHSGVKHLVQTGYVDPERVGIWGSSYGGLMTMMSLFKKPGVYAAGIAGAPATNVAHAYPGQMWVMGEPSGDDQPERYQQQSALYHTSGLEDPLMIIHGTKDPVVLYSDTIAVVEKLIAEQKMFELVTLPGTSHGWDNEGNDVRLFSFKKMVEFFNRHLQSPF
ncbi:prolyl oligopeptidase family serine peptidase [Marinicella litoralis]|uniref:Dipeptidyl-peptidase IV n=1 Tax=Marinicella litoralis TaxID=644220 RepID=A0A4R6XJZ0_9GAMM|nr:prolyl oligopeptidase family serine peptidase [Marinicella litoralis]TDR17563.1 dipeptidyl-peptidase IV [Marinicella litoralis]